MKGYWIAHVEVTNQEAWGQYIEGARGALQKHGANPLARGGKHVQLEGDTVDRPRNIVIEFPSYDDAVNCYNSDEYQAAIKLREGAGNATIMIVEGV